VRAIRCEQDQGNKPTVVAFTANTHSEALDRCMDAGMDDYLTKPAELVALRAKLESGVRADIAALQGALERADYAALRGAAHRIKGSALTIGAERLAAL